jgi:hypothetical protein
MNRKLPELTAATTVNTNGSDLASPELCRLANGWRSLMLHHRPTSSSYPRRRLLALIFGTTGLVGLLTIGIALSLATLTHPSRDTAPRTPGASSRPVGPEPVNAEILAARDALAARPMPDTGTGGAYGPQVSTRTRVSRSFCLRVPASGLSRR